MRIRKNICSRESDVRIRNKDAQSAGIAAYIGANALVELLAERPPRFIVIAMRMRINRGYAQVSDCDLDKAAATGIMYAQFLAATTYRVPRENGDAAMPWRIALKVVGDLIASQLGERGERFGGAVCLLQADEVGSLLEHALKEWRGTVRIKFSNIESVDGDHRIDIGIEDW